jgi:hypothetical protein
MRTLSSCLHGLLAFALVPVAAGCGAGAPASMTTMAPPPDMVGGVTFHKDIEPLLQKHCQSCHSPGHIAPFPLISYLDAKGAAGLMVVQTKARKMPPWGALPTSTCNPRLKWQDDKRLTDDEIALIETWQMAGAPEGDPRDAPPPYTPPADGLPGVQAELSPAAPFTSSGDTDQYECFVMDPKFAQSMYLNGWHFIAGNPSVVHHALMYVTQPKVGETKATLLADLAARGADGMYPCFGGPDIPGGRQALLVGAWAPGSVPALLPANVATTVAKDAVFVMQVHYHPAGAKDQKDSTRFQMRFLQSAPEWQMVTSLLGNFAGRAPNGDGLQPDADGKIEFRIPANDPAKQIKQIATIPAEVAPGIKTPELRLLSVGTHMHYVGRDMSISIQRGPTISNGDPPQECLLETPDWNFNWQRWYVYDVSVDNLPRVNAGDKLFLDCQYDNTMNNPFVATALAQQHLSQPRDVFLGEQTLDEMCLGVFGVIFKL